jgi:hypothetical protein
VVGVRRTGRKALQPGDDRAHARPFRGTRSDRQSLTTSNGEPPLSLLDENPERPVRRFPGATASELWNGHREAAGMSLAELSAEEFAPRFTEAWRRNFEFQASRGLYLREGDRFVATGKIALRSVLDFHLGLRRRTGPAYAAGLFVAVLAASVALACAAARLAA